MRSSLFALVIALFLSACASPRYQTIYRYEAPTDTSARACLQSCEPKLATCQSNCQQRYQSCLKEIEPLVETSHGEAVKRYESELDRYRLELHHYQLQWAMGGVTLIRSGTNTGCFTLHGQNLFTPHPTRPVNPRARSI